MDRLETMQLLREYVERELIPSRDQIVGVGIGLADPKAVTPSSSEQYSIVVVAQPGQLLQEFTLPEHISVPREKLLGLRETLAGVDLPEVVESDVRIEHYEFIPLTPAADVPVAPGEFVEAAGIFQAGSQVFNQQGRWIGTGGCVLNVGGANSIVSNHHVLIKGAGSGTTIKDKAGQDIAQVVGNGAPNYDAAHARLLNPRGYSNEVPRIGQIRSLKGGINIGWFGRKYGATTAYTEFHVRLILPVPNLGGGLACQLVNMGGWNVPVTGAGDSGAVAIGNNNEAIGLMFAGDTEVGKAPNGQPVYAIAWCVDITQAFPGATLPK
jgi:hypothetical protein